MKVDRVQSDAHMQSLNGSTSPTHVDSNGHGTLSKIALWRTPTATTRRQDDSDDDDDTSNDLNDTDDETDLPIMFWLQDPVRYLIAVEAEFASPGLKPSHAPFPTIDSSVVTPLGFTSYEQTIRLARHGGVPESCMRPRRSSLRRHRRSVQIELLATCKHSRSLQPYSRFGLEVLMLRECRSDENVVCSQRPKRRPVQSRVLKMNIHPRKRSSRSTSKTKASASSLHATRHRSAADSGTENGFWAENRHSDALDHCRRPALFGVLQLLQWRPAPSARGHQERSRRDF